MPIDFYLETFGCSLNMADSDMITSRLIKLGYHRVSSPDSADLIVVNTCGVKEPTEDRVIHRLTELSSHNVPLIITGCLPKISFDRIVSAAPGFSAILGPQAIDTLGSVAERVLAGERNIVHLDSDSLSKLRYFEGPPDSVICTVPICEGCLGNCAYCAVKFARGKVRSYSISEIKSVVKRCTHLGYREIRLTSQDAGVYGADTGSSLIELLKDLDSIEGEHIFRLGMFNPDLVLGIIDDLLDVMDSKHFFKFFHAPLQSGSDRILRLMRRRYTTDVWLSIINVIRNRFPDATISTDIIVGFPGESDDDFQQTIEIIRRTRPQIVNISKYGDRPKTAASCSTEKIDTHTKKERSRSLSKLVHEISAEHNASWIGQEVPAIVTDKAPKGGFLARTCTYKPVIIHDDVSIGKWIKVSIISAGPTHITGRAIL